MRIVHFNIEGKSRYGMLQGNVVQGFRGNPFNNFKYPTRSFPLDGSKYKLGDVKLLAPCLPTKILGVGLNYRPHIEEATSFNRPAPPIPSIPIIFLMPPTAVIGTEDNIVLPRLAERVDYEGELGVVIGRQAKDVPEEKAKEYVMGYTCFNDVSDRDSQLGDKEATRGKGHDTFAPMGPWIETEIDPDDLKLETYLNGELRQSARTSELIFPISKVISFISSAMTLLPGDVISTGTPSGVGPLSPGDVVEVRIEKIGTLRNFVVGQN